MHSGQAGAELDAELNEVSRLSSVYHQRRQEIGAGTYSWLRVANRFAFCQAFHASIEQLAAEGLFPLDGRRIADIGCGSGKWLVEFLQWGAAPQDLAGIDLAADCIAQARGKLPSADLRAGHAGDLPWADASFDIVAQFTLFTSILNPEVKLRAAREMLRVLKPGGVILWYDFWANNPRNPNVRGVGSREIRALFPGCEVRLRRVELAPPVARRIVPVSWVLGWILAKVWFLRTHYIATIRKPAA